ncbi:MAG: tRNA modification GTPase [Thermoguttaceae bacterium]
MNGYNSSSWSTIVAESSPMGGGHRGIVRVSGDDALDVVAPLVACDFFERDQMPIVRNVSLRLWGDAATVPAVTVPATLYTFPHGKSYTGETLVEIHTFGSPPIISALKTRLLEVGADRGVRLAERGEFTLRSVLSGRLDLTQAEAVHGIIEADDSAALAVALSQLAGGVQQLLAPLEETLQTLLADIEAGLDFADEDITFRTPSQIVATLKAARSQLANVREQIRTRADTTAIPNVVIIGKLNAGKSTLWNALVARSAESDRIPRAITSSEPWTTRDAITAEVAIDSLRLRLIDTAGTSDATDAVQRAAELAANTAVATAALCLHCVAADDVLTAQHVASPKTLLVVTKSDCAEIETREQFDGTVVSAKTGDGVEQLCREIARRLQCTGTSGNVVATTAARTHAAIVVVDEALTSAEVAITTLQDESLTAAEVRRAAAALGELFGRGAAPEDTLHAIFSRFCVGK